MKTPTVIAITAAFALTACGGELPKSTTSSQSSALVEIAGEGDGCTTLFAGQTIDAGTVCVSVDSGADTSAQCGAGSSGVLNVTYSTTGGWELTEAHLAAGTSLDDIPLNKAGNPKIGNFPYNSGDITGSTSHSFSVPLCHFGLDGASSVCDPVTALIAAHAAVRKDNGDGSYQTETGWGDGDRFKQRGSWAEYFPVVITCSDNPEPPEELDCQTAWAKASYTFDCTAPNNGDPANYNCGPSGDISEKWGWYGTFAPSTGFSSTLYAGAGQNNLSKGEDSGSVNVSCSGSDCDIAVQTSGEWLLADFQAYIGCDAPDTAAPGQLGHNWSDQVNYQDGDSSFIGSVSGLSSCSSGSYFIAVHTTVCRPKL